ncbi:MAG: type IV toxin-antitoxin system AbiEi family antitoxin [Bdellovibrionota bacterium]
MNKEKQLIEKALERIELTLGYKLATFKLDGQRFDGTLNFKAKTKEKKYTIECKKNFNRQMLGNLIRQLNKAPNNGMLITDYVNSNLAKELKELDIAFIDTVGNAYINNPPLYVYITGNKAIEKPDRAIGKVYQPAGMKVLFVLLCKPELINEAFREIAKLAGVALGTVAKVVEDLKKRNFLVEYKKERKLNNLKKLFDEWIMLYPAVLKPKLLIGRYKAPDNNDWWKKQRKIGGYLWSGDVAAQNLVNYMKPAKFTVYTKGDVGPFAAAHELKKDLNGEVEILKAFWDKDFNIGDNLNVHPIMVYADLIATADPRAIETAEVLYEQELTRLFG